MRSGVALTLLAIGLVGSSRESRADSYRFTTLDIPGTPQGINNIGQIATSDGILNPNGAFTPITVPGSLSTQVFGINDKGQIVGEFDAPAPFGYSCNEGFIKTAAAFTTIDYGGCNWIGPDAPSISTIGINNSGLVAGTHMGSSANSISGFFYRNGAVTTLTLPGSFVTYLLAVNNDDQILGFYGDTAAYNFLYKNGVVTRIRLDEPGASGLNDSGQIVGNFFDYNVDAERGFLYSNGKFATFDVPGATNTLANGINDVGQIVGTFTDSHGVSHGFLATPVPEPTSFLLLSPVLSAFWLSRHRKRLYVHCPDDVVSRT